MSASMISNVQKPSQKKNDGETPAQCDRRLSDFNVKLAYLDNPAVFATLRKFGGRNFPDGSGQWLAEYAGPNAVANGEAARMVMAAPFRAAGNLLVILLGILAALAVQAMIGAGAR